MSEEIWEVDEAANYLQLSSQTVRAMARQGKLPAFKIGKSWRFRKMDMLQLGKDEIASIIPKRYKILVVDDDQLVHNLIEESVKKLNVTIEKAYDEKTGIEIVRSGDFDFAFLELSIPDINGLEVLKEIRLKKGNIPVAIVTSFSECILMEEALKHGPLILLAKPFLSSQVIECLEGLTLSSTASLNLSRIRNRQ